MSDIMWDINEAIAVARFLEPIAVAHNYHVSLGGGVLLNGFSTKDLDIIFYVHTRFNEPCVYKNNLPNKVVDSLLQLGWRYNLETAAKDKGSGAHEQETYKVVKQVYQPTTNRRVDLIFILPG